MQIAAIHDADGKIFGTLQDKRFRPLLARGAPVRDLRQVIALLADRAGALEQGTPVALDRVKLAAPVGPLAKNVMCVGKNYHDHAQEFARSGVDQSGDKQESPADPVVFTKAVTSLADPGQGIPASSDPRFLQFLNHFIHRFFAALLFWLRISSPLAVFNSGNLRDRMKLASFLLYYF